MELRLHLSTKVKFQTTGRLPVGSDEGWVYKTADDGKFYVSDGFGNYTELTGVTALKGEKGP